MASSWICNSWYSKSAVGCCDDDAFSADVVVVVVVVVVTVDLLLLLVIGDDDDLIVVLPVETYCIGGFVCGENAVHTAR